MHAMHSVAIAIPQRGIPTAAISSAADQFGGSALEREPAVFPGVEAAVEIDRLTTLSVKELGHACGAGANGTHANNTLV